MKKVTIKAPEGMVINQEAFDKGRIEFVPEKPKKRVWEDFGKVSGFYVANDSWVMELEEEDDFTSVSENRNIWPTKELAEASLALCQLLQWRKKIVGDWEPDWTDKDVWKFNITSENNFLVVCNVRYTSSPLSFQTREQASSFLEEFRELVEVARPLL